MGQGGEEEEESYSLRDRAGEIAVPKRLTGTAAKNLKKITP
jgi:hypothetical protein